MADTLPNIKLNKDTWTDLYQESGISVGTQLQVQNTGQTRVLLHTGANAPTEVDGFNVLPVSSEVYTNQEMSAGEWARSVGADGSVNVGEF